MMRNLRNLAAVLALTAATALTVFVAVQYAVAPTFSADQSMSAASVASDTALTCPRTGCTASSCHATQGGGDTAMRF